VFHFAVVFYFNLMLLLSCSSEVALSKIHADNLCLRRRGKKQFNW